MTPATAPPPVKERPILFSAPMVRAILNGTKTQTRRIVKNGGDYTHADRITDAVDGGYFWRFASSVPGGIAMAEDECPYGQPGDRLWIRETWRPKVYVGLEGDSVDGVEVTYATDGSAKWFHEHEIPESWVCPIAAKTSNVPSIHMPRWASRLTLEITDVRVERLREISYEDSLREGIKQAESVPYGDYQQDTIDNFQSLWESINGPGSWDANPWVWVVSFKPIAA